ncbi:MAG: hypothetical protein N4A63_04880 [Vallitalea sp.]|jgi:hypothetical protein|nr:hypothetical protein [Vallitalea sp.]
MKKINSTYYTRKLKEARKEQGLCIDCSKPHTTGYIRCQECLDKQAEYARKKRKSSKS